LGLEEMEKVKSTEKKVGFDILLICFSASVFSHFLFGIPELFFEVYRFEIFLYIFVLKKICRGESIDKKDKIGKIYNL
jgi:hypothetical protein